MTMGSTSTMEQEAIKARQFFMRHRVAELFGVDSTLLDSEDRMKPKVLEVARTLNMIVWEVFCHKFEKGVSIVIIISDSHVAVHTWPEYEYAHFDIIVCSEQATWDRLEEVLQKEFSPQSMKATNLDY